MIELTQEITRLIGAEGEKAYPNECCGALFGHFSAQGDARVTAIFPIVNARESEEQYHRLSSPPMTPCGRNALRWLRMWT
ncbi:Mov34/MPN/PAD-1 family protein [Klebsiella michiganensis]|nr:Mov34/MPN/PAD-1 family protein [Klebsiella michiganensis]